VKKSQNKLQKRTSIVSGVVKVTSGIFHESTLCTTSNNSISGDHKLHNPGANLYNFNVIRTLIRSS